MKLEELERAVALQQKAYGLLLWVKKRARSNAHILSSEGGEPFANGETCAEWMACNLTALPQAFRPQPDELRPFGFVFSSFFSTSFRVAEVRHSESVETTLVLGATEFKGRRHKRHAEKWHEEAATKLRQIALAALANESLGTVPEEKLRVVESSPEVQADLTLWAYGCEVVRRAHFPSQGPGVHRLWLGLDPKIRKNLSAEKIWSARERLRKRLEKELKANNGI